MSSIERPVLIVDDDDDLREALWDTLKDEGHRVVQARDGQHALSQLRAAQPIRPFLILLDWMMPIMDGLTFARELAQDPRLCQIPVVLLSADTRAKERAQGVRLSGVLNKPVNVMDLLRVVDRFRRLPRGGVA